MTYLPLISGSREGSRHSGEGFVDTRTLIVAAGVLTAIAGTSFATVVPFTETFSSPAANWSSAGTFTALTYPASGGPDGSGYGSAEFNFANAQNGEQPLLFRGQSNFNSSGNAFVGNWIADGVTSFSFSVRHNGPASVSFFARFAPAAGPGAVALAMPALAPNTWITYTVPIDPGAFFIFEGTTFNSTFSDVARVQVGVLVDANLAGHADPVTFDIDNVRIVPAPGAASLLGLGVIAGVRRRRRSR